MELVKVLLSEIDLSSENYDRYLFNYERVSNSITDSIKKVGLINSVIIKKNLDADQTYIVVCGYQRILVCQELGWECIEAKVIDEFSDEEALLLALHDNLSTRGFNEIEKAIVLKKFMNIGYSHDRLISDIVPLLGIPQSIKIIDRYLSVLSLESEIKRFVAKGELELEKAFLLVSLDDTDKDIAF
ncbi:MAG: ParB N-terminal domain-containing protein, partial [Maribacter sp.]|nr:ParB N-terminal domain-containing protein [Maribacter sp.]